MQNDSVNLLNPKLSNNTPQNPRGGLYAFIGLAFILVLGFGVWRMVFPKNNSVYPTNQVTLQPKKFGFLQIVKNFIFPSQIVMEGQAEDRINILILGIGGGKHDGPYLSDTNIIASIKPSTKEVALITVPRDLGVKVGDYGWRKINSADAFGEVLQPGLGGDYSRKIFEQAFNLTIPYYARVDFTAFEDLINQVGNININVPNAFTDSQFPGPNNSYVTINFNAGEQTLNGEQALNYARSRHGNNGESSDFARSRRQQLILQALKEKILSAETILNPFKIQGLINAINSHVQTNLSLEQLTYLASLVSGVGTKPKSLVLDSSPNGFLINTTGDAGAFILSPKTGNFNEVNLAIANVFTSTTTPETAIVKVTSLATTTPVMGTVKIEVQNGTWRAGLAAKYGKKLTEQGYWVINVGNSFKRPIAKTSIYLLKQNSNLETAKKLGQLLNAPFATQLPEWLSPNYDSTSTEENEQGMKHNDATEILIILGEDAKEN